MCAIKGFRKTILKTIAVGVLCLASSSCATKGKLVKKYMDKDVIVKIETSEGNLKVKLYNETQKHKENFLTLIENKTYEGTLFHRVIKEFMIQAGDPESKNAPKGKMLGGGDLGYTVPAEFVYPKYFHKKGTLCAARQGDDVNPEKNSSACQFYLVTGRVFSKAELSMLEKRINEGKEVAAYKKAMAKYAKEIYMARKSGDEFTMVEVQDKVDKEARNILRTEGKFSFTDQQIEAYTTVGGSPHLDGSYTVFGEIIEGLDVIDKIQQAKTDRHDRPEEDIKIKKVSVAKR
ncbi:MAG: peptidylprolyl isomerase [Bacteroides sp.]|nr:peptidylprolyl isomerase [Bacteroides sp.]